jgi:hypothetical protein
MALHIAPMREATCQDGSAAVAPPPRRLAEERRGRGETQPDALYLTLYLTIETGKRGGQVITYCVLCTGRVRSGKRAVEMCTTLAELVMFLPTTASTVKSNAA